MLKEFLELGRVVNSLKVNISKTNPLQYFWLGPLGKIETTPCIDW